MNETKGNGINWTLLLPSYSYVTKNSRAERTRRPANELDSSFQQEYRYILPSSCGPNRCLLLSFLMGGTFGLSLETVDLTLLGEKKIEKNNNNKNLT